MRNRDNQMTSSRTLGALTAVALALFTVVGTAMAQPHEASGTEAELPNEAPVEAMPMTAAEVPLSDWDELADRRSEAAEKLRPWEHASRADHLWKAAHLHLHGGEELQAYRKFRGAADAALDAGRVFQSAQANLRAARLAAELARTDEAEQLLDRVRELRDAPELNRSQRRLLTVEVDRYFGLEGPVAG